MSVPLICEKAMFFTHICFGFFLTLFPREKQNTNYYYKVKKIEKNTFSGSSQLTELYRVLKNTDNRDIMSIKKVRK